VCQRRLTTEQTASHIKKLLVKKIPSTSTEPFFLCVCASCREFRSFSHLISSSCAQLDVSCQVVCVCVSEVKCVLCVCYVCVMCVFCVCCACGMCPAVSVLCVVCSVVCCVLCSMRSVLCCVFCVNVLCACVCVRE